MLRTSLLKHNLRVKQKDSLPLNAAIGELGDRKSPSVVQGQSSGGGLGDPQKLKACEVGRGCPLPTGESERDLGRGLCPLPRIFFLNLCEHGEFRCILGGTSCDLLTHLLDFKRKL